MLAPGSEKEACSSLSKGALGEEFETRLGELMPELLGCSLEYVRRDSRGSFYVQFPSHLMGSAKEVLAL